MSTLLSNIVSKQRAEIPSILAQAPIERTAARLLNNYLPHQLIKAIIGPRRAGKSSLVHQCLRGKRYAYFNFEDEELTFEVNGEELLESFAKQYPDYEYIFLDEVQLLARWEQFVNRLGRLGKNVIITGSNSKLLSGELASSLTGRYELIELFPFSFHEILVARQKEASPEEFLSYLNTGGFPMVALQRASPTLFLRTLWDAIILKDLVGRYRIRKIPELKSLLYLILQQMSCRTTMRALEKAMQGQLDVATINKFVAYAAHAYLCISLQNFSFKSRVRINSAKKIYLYDNGFYTAHKASGADLGKLLENQVCIELMRLGYKPNIDLYHYIAQPNHEVDFLVLHQGRPYSLIQVAYGVQSLATKDREMRALLTAARELSLTKLYLATMDNAEQVLEVEGHKILAVPVMRLGDIVGNVG